MPRHTARRWLWVAALVTMPVPFYLGELEWAPVLRLGFLVALFGAVVLAEGGSTVLSIVGIGAVQLLVYGVLFFAGADALSRVLERIGSPPLRVAAVGSAVFLLLASALLVPIYDTPLSSARARSTLWQLFE